MAKKRCDELRDKATDLGFRAQLAAIAEPYGGLLKYVTDLYQRAEDRAKGY